MAETQAAAALDDRAQRLLRVLIEKYLEDGQPVGSRTLSRDAGIAVSPATVRNVMADLEELGLLSAPHTSAGRIPTQSGLRLFVDSLLRVKPLKKNVVGKMERELNDSELSSQALVQQASNLLSSVTKLAGVVSVPRPALRALKRIEFLKLSTGRVLAIMVMSDGEVQNRIIQTDKDYSSSELEQTANYLNDEMGGRSIDELRHLLLGDMQQVREDMNRLMQRAIRLGQSLFSKDTGGDYVLAGQTNLMAFEELSHIEKLKPLFEAFNKKHQMLNILDASLSAEGVKIFIGGESGHHFLDDCSLVAAPYTVDNEVVGVLGVIGPTRMRYSNVIPVVDITAKLLGAALKFDR